MRVRVQVTGQTFYDVQDAAHIAFQKFFGEVEYKVIGSSAHPGVKIGTYANPDQIISWEAEYEATTT